MDDLLYDLQRLGFSEHEARVYLTLLQLGRARASQVADRSGIHRATTYDVLKSLRTQGLVTSIKEGSDQLFSAEPPARILANLYVKQQSVEEQRRRADPLVMRLQVFHNQSPSKPKIRYVESMEGLRLMQHEYEGLKEDMIQIVGYDRFLQLHSPHVSKEHKTAMARAGKRIRSILVTDSFVPVPPDLNVEVVFLPTALAPIEGEMTVCGDRVALFSYADGLIAVEIHSKPIADTVRATLELAFEEAKRLMP